MWQILDEVLVAVFDDTEELQWGSARTSQRNASVCQNIKAFLLEC